MGPGESHSASWRRTWAEYLLCKYRSRLNSSVVLEANRVVGHWKPLGAAAANDREKQVQAAFKHAEKEASASGGEGSAALTLSSNDEAVAGQPAAHDGLLRQAGIRCEWGSGRQTRFAVFTMYASNPSNKIQVVLVFIEFQYKALV
jgi:hypothetical protein